MLLTQKRLRQLLGILWLIDGLLQLQPQMFTMNMVNGVMVPTMDSQPAPIAASLQWIISVTTHNLVLVNLTIAIVQIALGVLLISGLWVRGTIIASVVWALVVWYGGEGMSMLLTGQAGILTGAPGAVLLYPLLGLLVYPRKEDPEQGLLPRSSFRYIFAGFWFFAALLQVQPYWWQDGQISQAIGGMVGQGGLNGFLIDPLLQRVSDVTAHSEVPLNSALIVVCLALGFVLVFVKEKQMRPVLIASIVVSILIWWLAQGFGMIFTGMATDFNSGLLLVVMALACWPRVSLQGVAQQRSVDGVPQPQSSAQPV
ncbi:MAG: hypothetical protein H0V70_14050 [Ktedonobacteraceae bacterium]|nr:hypothetical protein [Ktedonobacteraceae bacterium]